MPRAPKDLKDDPKLDQHLESVDPLTWAESGKMRIEGQLVDITDRPYQKDWLQVLPGDPPPKRCKKCGAQVGKTIGDIIPKLHGLIHGYYPLGVMYIFPTSGAVQKFSQSRFTPIIEDNPKLVGQFISHDADNLELKRIGKSKLLFRGATVTQKIRGEKKDTVALRSDPVDAVNFDEVDLMDPDMVFMALQRMSASKIQEESYVSTPSIPDFGIDKLFQESDQRVWMIRCTKCNKETCLELEFPQCLVERPNGDVYRVCVHCHDGILYTKNGHWVPQYPSRSQDMIGWTISQLNAPDTRLTSPKNILKNYRDPPNGNLAEVYNSMLGMAYISAENRLRYNDVIACCGADPMQEYGSGDMAMGVDVGATLNVVIGHRLSEKQYRIIKMARVGTFTDIHDLASRFHVKRAVFDLYPETRKVRDFGFQEPYAVYGCAYSEHQKGTFNWNDQERTVTVNRTEICDATHELVVNPGRLEIPRLCEEVIEYGKQMCNMAKVLQDDEETGIKHYFYRKLGPDHYRHATNYFLLAADKISPARHGGRKAQKPKPVSALGWT